MLTVNRADRANANLSALCALGKNHANCVWFQINDDLNASDLKKTWRFFVARTSGVILTWCYLATNFTGFGSFKPHSKLRLDLTKAVNGKEGVVELAAVSNGNVVCCLCRQQKKGLDPQTDGGALVVVEIGEASRLKRKIKLPELKADDACALAVGSEIGVETGLFYGYLCTRKEVSISSSMIYKSRTLYTDPYLYGSVF